MSGANSASGAAAASGPRSYRATVVESGGTAYLFLRGSLGSISPNDTFKGNNINRLQASTTVPFRFELEPISLAQSYFSRIVVQKTSGVFVVLSSASAVYTANSGLGTTLWEWGAIVTDQVWTAAGTYPVLIFP